MKNKFVLSAFLGIPFAISVYIICFFIVPEEAFILALFSGLGFYLLLFIFLLMHERFLNKKYTEFEKNIFLPIFYKTNGNFNLGNGKIRNGNIYFCEAGIICVSVDERPYTLDEIAIQNIEQYQFDNIH